MVSRFSRSRVPVLAAGAAAVAVLAVFGRACVVRRGGAGVL